MLESIKNRFFERHFQKRLSNRPDSQESNVNFENSKSVGILFNGTDISHFAVVRQYVQEYKKQGKKVKTLGFIDSKSPNPSLVFDYFSKKDINWYGKPGSGRTDVFQNEDFDILISAYLDQTMPLIYLSTFTKAKLKVGLYFPDYTDASDMMVNIKGEQNLNNFFQEIHHYLNIFANND